MSIAGRAGKLAISGDAGESRWHRHEDLLTADVFGAYRYLPPRVGVLPFLCGARAADGTSLADALARESISLDELTCCEIAFWPSLEGKEPDILVLVGGSPDSHRVAVLVEVKLHAEQHEIGGISQLGFYARAHSAGTYEGFDEPLPLIRPVVYVTRHHDLPAAELARAEGELAYMNAPGGGPRIFWTNWTAALEHAAGEWSARKGTVPAEPWWKILEDLVDDIEARGFFLPRDQRTFPLPPLPPLDPRPLSGLRRVTAPATPRRPLPASMQLDDIDGALRRWRIA